MCKKANKGVSVRCGNMPSIKQIGGVMVSTKNIQKLAEEGRKKIGQRDLGANEIQQIYDLLNKDMFDGITKAFLSGYALGMRKGKAEAKNKARK